MYERLQSALTNVSLMKGIKQASPLAQTSCLEGFHSVLNHFTPKMIAYSYIGMYCRYGIVQSYLIVLLVQYSLTNNVPVHLSDRFSNNINCRI